MEIENGEHVRNVERLTNQGVIMNNKLRELMVQISEQDEEIQSLKEKNHDLNTENRVMTNKASEFEKLNEAMTKKLKARKQGLNQFSMVFEDKKKEFENYKADRELLIAEQLKRIAD